MALYTWKDGELVTAAKLNAYGEGLEQMKEDAESAKTAAESAKTAAESAKTAAAGSATEAASAKTAAESAKTGAESAKTAAASSATAAGNAKTAAESAKTAAESAKTAAAGSATEAAASKEAAETANTSAQSAKTAAETAAQSAESAKTSAAGSASSAADDAQRAEDAVAHNPTIQSGVWYVWDPETGSYASTGVQATGQMTVQVTYQQGDTATTPPTGTWSSSVPEVAQGKYLWTKTLFSDGTIGYSVARQGMDGEGAVISVNGESGEVTITTDDVDEGAANKYVTATEKDKIANLPENTGTAISGKIDKVTSATEGNIPTLTADGQLQDSGKTIDELGGAFIITYDRTTNTADKTYDEMEAAYNAGKELILRYDYPGFVENDLKLSYVFKKSYSTNGYGFRFSGGSKESDGGSFPYMIASFRKSSDFPSGKWGFYSSATLPEVNENYAGAILMVNGDGEWNAYDPPFAPKPTTITGTLTAGSTSLVLSNSAVTTDSTIDIYTDKWGVNPTDVVVEAGKVTLTFEAQAAVLNVKVEVR